LVLRGLVAPLSHLSKSETECEVTPPPDDAGQGAVSMTTRRNPAKGL
jgi:hypothetical protein